MSFWGWVGMILTIIGQAGFTACALWGLWDLLVILFERIKRRRNKRNGLARNGRVWLTVLPVLADEPQVWRGRVSVMDDIMDAGTTGHDMLDLLVDCSAGDKYLLVTYCSNRIAWEYTVATELYLEDSDGAAPDLIDAQQLINFFTPDTVRELRASLVAHVKQFGQQDSWPEGLAH